MEIGTNTGGLQQAARIPRFLFLNSFSRGGSSVVWNILQSHPEIVSPLLETHQCFVGTDPDWMPLRHLLFDLRFGLPKLAPLRLDGKFVVGQGIMNPKNVSHRRMSPRLARHVASTLQVHRLAALGHAVYGEKRPGERYTSDEMARAMLATKNINGIIWLTPELHRHFPGARFVGLVRDGLALWEGRSRRGAFRRVETFAAWYVRMIEEFERQSATIPSYRLMRFEDLLDDAERFIVELFDAVGEDHGAVDNIRLKIKSHYVGDQYVEVKDGPKVAWVRRGDLYSVLERRVSTAQRDRVPTEERDRFMAIAGPAMERMGYA